MDSPSQQQHSAATTAQNSPAAVQTAAETVPLPALTSGWGMQPSFMLSQVEDMLISPRVDTHSPAWRSFPTAPVEEPAYEADVCTKRDQNRAKPRASVSSLADVMNY